jgi:6-phosphogluconolactonase (cycloisomerase 2 family)
VIDASGRFLYTSDPIEEALFGFRVASANGALSQLDAGGTSPALNNVYGLVTTPSGFLYATSMPLLIPNDPQRGYVLSYRIDDSGTLRSVADPIQAGEDAHIPVVHPNGRFLYTPNAGSNDISGYAIDVTGGTLAPLPGSPFAAGPGVVALALDPGGHYLYAVNRGDRSVSTFSVDTRTGALRAAGPAVDGPGTTQASIVVGPNGRFVHVAGSEEGSLWTYAVDSGSGRLALIPNGRLTIPSGPGALAAAPAR